MAGTAADLLNKHARSRHFVGVSGLWHSHSCLMHEGLLTVGGRLINPHIVTIALLQQLILLGGAAVLLRVHPTGSWDVVSHKKSIVVVQHSTNTCPL